MGTEIERKFLLDHIPEAWLQDVAATDIRQGYIAATDSRDVRVREKGGAYFLTVKDGSGLVRGETEITIDQAQFDALWPLTAQARVEKQRYKVPHQGVTMEVDVFHGALAGLVLMEAEFDSVEAAESWPVPTEAARDVTEDKAYKNVNLALKGLPD